MGAWVTPVKMLTQTAAAVEKAKSMLEVMRKGIENITTNVIMLFIHNCGAAIHGTMCCCGSCIPERTLLIWKLCRKMGTKMIKDLELLPYEEWSQCLATCWIFIKLYM